MLKIVSTVPNLENTKFSNVMKLLELKSQAKSCRLFRRWRNSRNNKYLPEIKKKTKFRYYSTRKYEQI